MKKKKAIQLNTIDLGGGTAKGGNCEAPDLSVYAKKEDVPTKVSELENDSEFVKSTSLGTAAFKNVEDLQGGGVTMSLHNQINGSVDNKTYIYTTAGKNNAIFDIDVSTSNVGASYYLLDSAGQKLISYSTSNSHTEVVVEQAQLGPSLYKITTHSSGTLSMQLVESPISYICFGLYSTEMPAIAVGEDRVTYNITEYA